MKINENIPSIGIVCNNEQRLAARLLVSGIRVLDAVEAQKQGYDSRPTIVPTLPRQPTPTEVQSITAGPETNIRLQLCRVPRSIGEAAVRAANEVGFRMNPDAYTEVDPETGLRAAYMGSRNDAARQLLVSIKPGPPDPTTGRRSPVKVGLHRDAWPDVNTQFMAGNMGPGYRYHCLAPLVTRETIGSLEHDAHVAYVQAHPDLQLYWLRLDPPGYDSSGPYAEAVLNAPVARTLHDGSTYDSPLPSTAFFCATQHLPDGYYPSIV